MMANVNGSASEAFLGAPYIRLVRQWVWEAPRKSSLAGPLTLAIVTSFGFFMSDSSNAQQMSRYIERELKLNNGCSPTVYAQQSPGGLVGVLGQKRKHFMHIPHVLWYLEILEGGMRWRPLPLLSALLGVVASPAAAGGPCAPRRLRHIRLPVDLQVMAVITISLS